MTMHDDIDGVDRSGTSVEIIHHLALYAVYQRSSGEICLLIVDLDQ